LILLFLTHLNVFRLFFLYYLKNMSQINVSDKTIHKRTPELEPTTAIVSKNLTVTFSALEYLNIDEFVKREPLTKDIIETLIINTPDATHEIQVIADFLGSESYEVYSKFILNVDGVKQLYNPILYRSSFLIYSLKDDKLTVRKEKAEPTIINSPVPHKEEVEVTEGLITNEIKEFMKTTYKHDFQIEDLGKNIVLTSAIIDFKKISIKMAKKGDTYDYGIENLFKPFGTICYAQNGELKGISRQLIAKIRSNIKLFSNRETYPGCYYSLWGTLSDFGILRRLPLLIEHCFSHRKGIVNHPKINKQIPNLWVQTLENLKALQTSLNSSSINEKLEKIGDKRTILVNSLKRHVSIWLKLYNSVFFYMFVVYGLPPATWFNKLFTKLLIHPLSIQFYATVLFPTCFIYSPFAIGADKIYTIKTEKAVSKYKESIEQQIQNMIFDQTYDITNYQSCNWAYYVFNQSLKRGEDENINSFLSYIGNYIVLSTSKLNVNEVESLDSETENVSDDELTEKVEPPKAKQLDMKPINATQTRRPRAKKALQESEMVKEKEETEQMKGFDAFEPVTTDLTTTLAATDDLTTTPAKTPRKRKTSDTPSSTRKPPKKSTPKSGDLSLRERANDSAGDLSRKGRIGDFVDGSPMTLSMNKSPFHGSLNLSSNSRENTWKEKDEQDDDTLS
jgi:hypothetical protein